MKLKISWQNVILAVAVAVIIVGYVEYRHYGAAKQIKDVRDGIAGVRQQISILNDSISTLASQDQAFVTKFDSTKEENSVVQDQIGKVSAAVSSLDKLSKTDPQLLQKYSKVYFLNEHYVPPALSALESQYTYNKGTTYQVHSQVLPSLIKMMDVARANGANLLVISAYRSFNTQAALKSGYKVTYGAGTANKFSADQGYSEHQLGTTVDFTTPVVGASFDNFEIAPEYKWLTEHAHEYGFALSYPKNNAYYKYEPWHWRFVGIDLATKLHREGKYFYDYEQRVINDYLLTIFN